MFNPLSFLKDLGRAFKLLFPALATTKEARAVKFIRHVDGQQREYYVPASMAASSSSSSSSSSRSAAIPVDNDDALAVNDVRRKRQSSPTPAPVALAPERIEQAQKANRDYTGIIL